MGLVDTGPMLEVVLVVVVVSSKHVRRRVAQGIVNQYFRVSTSKPLHPIPLDCDP